VKSKLQTAKGKEQVTTLAVCFFLPILATCEKQTANNKRQKAQSK